MSTISKRHRKKPVEIQRSPKGLLTNTSKRLHRDQKLPETRQLIADSILSWRQFATALREAPPDKKPKKPADYAEADGVLDRPYTAARVLNLIDMVESRLRLIERNFADGSAPSLSAVHEILHAALLLATRAHQLTIADNEIAIVLNINAKRQVGENNTARSKESARKYQRWQAMADKIWDRHPDWSKSAVAREIAKTLPSDDINTNDIDTIRRHITKRQK